MADERTRFCMWRRVRRVVGPGERVGQTYGPLLARRRSLAVQNHSSERSLPTMGTWTHLAERGKFASRRVRLLLLASQLCPALAHAYVHRYLLPAPVIWWPGQRIYFRSQYIAQAVRV